MKINRKEAIKHACQLIAALDDKIMLRKEWNWLIHVLDPDLVYDETELKFASTVAAVFIFHTQSFNWSDTRIAEELLLFSKGIRGVQLHDNSMILIQGEVSLEA